MPNPKPVTDKGKTPAPTANNHFGTIETPKGVDAPARYPLIPDGELTIGPESGAIRRPPE